MRARLFVEVEIDEAALRLQFGDKFTEMVAARTFEESIARVTMAFLSNVAAVKEAKAIHIPEMITGNRIIT